LPCTKRSPPPPFPGAGRAPALARELLQYHAAHGASALCPRIFATCLRLSALAGTWRPRRSQCVPEHQIGGAHADNPQRHGARCRKAISFQRKAASVSGQVALHCGGAEECPHSHEFYEDIRCRCSHLGCGTGPCGTIRNSRVPYPDLE